MLPSYHGSAHQTRLGTAIKGIMEPNLKYKSDKGVILKWIQQGTDEPNYNEKIAPILKRDCVICHTPSVNNSLPDLTRYATVFAVAHVGGAKISALVCTSHIHLFGIAFILFLIGKIFLLCDLNIYAKRGHWSPLLRPCCWMCRPGLLPNTPSFAYVVVYCGILMGGSMGFQILLSVYQMWFFSVENAQ